eukprot:SAG31_NODE_5327_length_2608_cov_3.352730_1_plen_434_part_00
MAWQLLLAHHIVLCAAAGSVEAAVGVTASPPALVHRVTTPGAQAKFPAMLEYVGSSDDAPWLVTSFSDQSDAFHEAGDTGQSFCSEDGVRWSRVNNTMGPWIVNGIVSPADPTEPSVAFTYMLKGQPDADASRAYLQGYTLKATASGVVQQSALNVSLEFPTGHQPAPYGTSKTAFGMVVTGAVVKLQSGGHLATLYGTYKGDGAMSPTNYSLVAAKSSDFGKSWKWLSTVASHKQTDANKDKLCRMPSESSTIYLKGGRTLFTVMRSSGGALCQTTSVDEALTWANPEPMPAVPGGGYKSIPAGVEPKLRVLPSGRLALTTGRPGIYLYIADDRGDGKPPALWHTKYSIGAAHNRLVSYRDLRFRSDVPDGGVNGTTSYTGLAVARGTAATRGGSNDVVFVSYDRLGNGWGTVSEGEASAVFVMKLTIDRGN